MADLSKAAIESAARCAYNRASEKAGSPADWDTHAGGVTRQHFYELVTPVLSAALPDLRKQWQDELRERLLSGNAIKQIRQAALAPLVMDDTDLRLTIQTLIFEEADHA